MLLKHVCNFSALTAETVAEFRDKFYRDPTTKLAQNVISRSDPIEACVSRKAAESTSHVFSHRVEEAKPVTNQKSSGRCWLFACLNAMRIHFVKEKNLDDFEFSQGHLFFWDKVSEVDALVNELCVHASIVKCPPQVERCNYFLHTVVETAKREPRELPGGRLLSFLLHSPASDGGQWDMVSNLIKKHGVMPKKCFPEAFSCENSRRMNEILKTKVESRQFCETFVAKAPFSLLHSSASSASSSTA
jgi:bleomycin hydrolase